EAERAAALKDQFLATLSHELRTPLNAILGWVHLARQTSSLAQLERPLEIIERNARTQAQLIEDLLDVSRIVSGEMRLATESVDVVGVAQAALNAAAPTANAKHINLCLDAEPGLAPIIGDAARLQQAVSNLLSNAIKFTSEGGHVDVRLRRCDDNVELTVQDDGIGITEAFLPNVFDRFRQADASTTRRHGGLGLGLAIVKQLAELHGGSVRASSPGHQLGATFVLSLPLVRDPESPQSTNSPLSVVQQPPSLSGVRVLIVDDEADAREFMGRVLSEADASVSLAASVDEALAFLERDANCIIVSDIGMPGRDGYDLIGAVRRRHDFQHVPAIAVTAFARLEDRNRAIKAGFQVHLAKPVGPYEMTLAVAKLARAGERTG
ncbi:MAG TPA: ATP-binding protein, partial [Polyangiaceae bacterium]